MLAEATPRVKSGQQRLPHPWNGVRIHRTLLLMLARFVEWPGAQERLGRLELPWSNTPTRDLRQVTEVRNDCS